MSQPCRKVVVDRSRCEGHARCMQEAPEVFDLDDIDNYALVIEGANLEDNREAIDMAILACPERALRWAK